MVLARGQSIEGADDMLNEEKEERARNVVREMSKMMNSGSSQTREIAVAMADEFIRDHRTLQQNMSRLMLEFIREVVKNGHYDLRNEASMKWMQMIEGNNRDVGFPYV